MASKPGRPPNGGSIKPGEQRALKHGLFQQQGLTADLIPPDARADELAQYVSDLGAAADAVWLGLLDIYYSDGWPAVPNIRVCDLIGLYAESGMRCHEAAAMIKGGGICPARLGPNLTDEQRASLYEEVARDASAVVDQVQGCTEWLSEYGVVQRSGDRMAPAAVLRHYATFVNRARRLLVRLAGYHRWREQMGAPSDVLARLREVGNGVAHAT